ncbi:hypothetical protein OEZ86_012323 [Tetradesmus obliquus]|nr:hypothetical protein OEZ86_012323 [Tetradesmus obliquus]
MPHRLIPLIPFLQLQARVDGLPVEQLDMHMARQLVEGAAPVLLSGAAVCDAALHCIYQGMQDGEAGPHPPVQQSEGSLLQALGAGQTCVCRLQGPPPPSRQDQATMQEAAHMAAGTDRIWLGVRQCSSGR